MTRLQFTDQRPLHGPPCHSLDPDAFEDSTRVQDNPANRHCWKRNAILGIIQIILGEPAQSTEDAQRVEGILHQEASLFLYYPRSSLY